MNRAPLFGCSATTCVIARGVAFATYAKVDRRAKQA